MSKITNGGSRVVFDSDGSYIEDKNTREKMYLKEKNGMYMLTLWTKIICSVAEHTDRPLSRQIYETGVRELKGDNEKLIRPILMQNVFDEMISEKLNEDANNVDEEIGGT